jgi:hypothetical protein
MTVFSPDSDPPFLTKSQRLLQQHQIDMIEEALRSIGDYGEVRLIVEKGRLRFLVTQKSIDTLKWQPGGLDLSSK